MAGQFDPAMLS